MQSGTLRGLLWMFLSTIGLSLSHVIVRYVSPEIPSAQSVFFRGFFALIIIGPLFVKQGWALFKTNRFPLHVLRAVFSVTSISCFYFALTTIPLAKATAIGFMAPVFVSLFAILILKEKSRPAHWIAMVLGLGGMLLVLRPGAIPLDFGTVMMLISTVLFAINLMVIKTLGKEDSSLVITAYITVLLLPMALPMAIKVWVWPNGSQYLLLALMGVINVISILLFTQSMKEAATTVIMPLDFFRLVWMALFGYLVFAEVPDIFTWVGGALIFCGASVVAASERPKTPLYRA